MSRSEDDVKDSCILYDDKLTRVELIQKKPLGLGEQDL